MHSKNNVSPTSSTGDIDPAPASPVQRPKSTRLRAYAQYGLDLLVLALAFGFSYLIRFDAVVPSQFVSQFALICPWVVLVEFALLKQHKSLRNSWRFVGLRECKAVLQTALLATCILLALRFITPWFAPSSWNLSVLVVPLGVIACNAVLVTVGSLGIRLLRRTTFEKKRQRRTVKGEAIITPTIIIGAGSAGNVLSHEIGRHAELGVSVVGFVDDDPALWGHYIDEVQVLGGVSDLPKIAESTGATQALIAIASVRGSQIAKIKTACDDSGLQVKIVPPINDLVNGSVNFAQAREVVIEDLLGRDPVDFGAFESVAALRGKTVLVTGAGGSIGSEICRQVLKAQPKVLIMVEQAETSLYQIDRELQPLRGQTVLIAAIGDVVDEPRMRDLFSEHRPYSVYHAAAHKHVPMMEANPCEAIKNNALGTRTVADLACEFQTESFVLISTDKAVNPTSVMGATKRLAEKYLQAIQRECITRFISVRFGNVLGSAGSVIPLFREQIAKGGPVTVTDPDMVRYFMTIPEACQLVLEAGAIGQCGDLLTLDMGEPVKIVTLAEQMIRLSGLTPGEDIDIEFVGMRPGEKLYEELAFDDEQMLATRCPKIFLHKPTGEPKGTKEALLVGIQAALDDPKNIRMRIKDVVTSYQPLDSNPITPTKKRSTEVLS